ncbi:MAG: YxiJ family protein [Pyrinomonadaceae bacterium]
MKLSEDQIKHLATIKYFYDQVCQGPFPYDDVLRIVKLNKAPDDLFSSLGYYWSNIAGYGSWGNRMLRWSPLKVQEARTCLRRDFFDFHPEYRSIRHKMKKVATPDLCAQFEMSERLRVELLAVLATLS